MGETYATRRANYDSVSERNRDQRSRDVKKVKDFHKRIDDQVSNKKERTNEKQIY